jgi:hypothetical protein
MSNIVEFFEYTNDQRNAMIKIEDFLNSGERMMVLEGKAGTGKTTTVTTITNKYHGKRKETMFLAPTHKARKVLQDMIDRKELGVKSSTLHSYFSLEQDYDDDGKEFYCVNNYKFNKKFEYYIKKYNKYKNFYILLVIDEISMIGKAMYNIISKILDEHEFFKVIGLGDRCQLSPIQKIKTVENDDKDEYEEDDEEVEEKIGEMSINELSPFFKEDFKYNCSLNEVKRSCIPSILNLYSIFRDYTLDENTNSFKVKLEQFLKIYKNDKNITVCTTKNRFMKLIHENIMLDDTRIICARNNTVKSYVQSVNERLYPNSKTPFNIGEKIYFTEYYKFCNSEDCNCLFHGKPSKYCNKSNFYTSDEVIIASCKEADIYSAYFDLEMKVYEFETNFILHNDKCLIIRKIHADDLEKFKRKKYKYRKLIKEELKDKKRPRYGRKKIQIKLCNKCNDLKKEEMCFKCKIQFESRYDLWNKYHTERKYFDTPFISATAITAYKSQGSSYKNIFVDAVDVDQCRRGTFLKSKELYTSITRARDRIYLLINLQERTKEIPDGLTKCCRCRSWRKREFFKLNKKGYFIKTCKICCEKARIRRLKEKEKKKEIKPSDFF